MRTRRGRQSLPGVGGSGVGSSGMGGLPGGVSERWEGAKDEVAVGMGVGGVAAAGGCVGEGGVSVRRKTEGGGLVDGGRGLPAGLPIVELWAIS